MGNGTVGLGITLDLALVTWVISASLPVACVVGVITALLFAGQWFVFPLSQRARRRRGNS